MGDSVKQIKIEGAAFLDYQKAKGLVKQKARKTRKVAHKDEQEGGFDVPPAPRINLKNANIARLGAEANPMKGGENTPMKQSPLAQTPGPVAMNTTPQTPTKSDIQPTKLPFTSPASSSNKQQGGNITTPGHIPNPQTATTPLPAIQEAQKVGTADVKEGGAKKIELAPSKKATKRTGIVLAPPRESKKRHIRGHTRKIRVQLSNMKRRMQTAKLIHKQSSEKSIAEIRKLLEEAKLIKAGNKSVPEPLLRHMYRDYLVLRSKAL